MIQTFNHLILRELEYLTLHEIFSPDVLAIQTHIP